MKRHAGFDEYINFRILTPSTSKKEQEMEEAFDGDAHAGYECARRTCGFSLANPG
jgi:hypothetical protein